MRNFVDLSTLNLESPQIMTDSAKLPHYFPPTQVRWLNTAASKGIVATSSDYIRIWDVDGKLQKLFHHDNPRDVCTPITSIAAGKERLASCDVYGILTLWDVEYGKQLHSYDLEQPLCDVAFGPQDSVAAVNNLGACYVIDLRHQDNVGVLNPYQRTVGPARIAWSDQRDLFAVAWQGQPSNITLYNGKHGQQEPQKPQMLRTLGAPSTVADLEWSPAWPELLCCCKEDGAVELWRLPDDSVSESVKLGDLPQRWVPCSGDVCTALTAGGELPDGQSIIVVATMSPHAQNAGGSLWIARLPRAPTFPRASRVRGMVPE